MIRLQQKIDGLKHTMSDVNRVQQSLVEKVQSKTKDDLIKKLIKYDERDMN